MKTRVLLCLITILLCLPPLVSAKDSWISVRSKNFLLVGNASDKKVRRVGTKLEQFRETFRQIFPKANFNSATPTTVIVFKNNNAYKPFKPVRADGKPDDGIAGYFQSGEDVNYITLSTEGESTDTYGTIFHEYVHFIINNNFGRGTVPPWFNEGLAEYYQTFEIENDQKAMLGKLQNNHLLYLQQQKLIPFETFFKIDSFSLHNQANHGRSIFYAQAWALIHYLQQGEKGVRSPQLTKFLNLIINNKPPREAFAEAFQTDYATMEKELKNYVSRNSYTGTMITLKDKLTFDAEMQTAALSETEAGAYLGDLLVHTNRLADGAKHLRGVLAADDKSAMAHASLGLALVRQNNFAEARTHLQKAVALNSNNYLPHYYYALALSREDMDASGFVRSFPSEKASAMRDALAQAIKLNPGFAESYSLLAFVNLVNNSELDNAIAALRKAIALEPGNQQFRLELARVYMRQEKLDIARQIAQKVSATADEPSLRNNAEILLASINSYAAQLQHIKELNARQPTDKPPTPFVELPAEVLINQSLNEALRKLQSGEKHFAGFLTKIECNGKDILFNVRTEDNQIIKLHSEEFQNLALMSFTPEATNAEFGCGARKTEDYIVVTYRPTTDAKAKFNGEIVALEFMPKTFKLIP